MFFEWCEALKVARKQTHLIDGQMVHHNRRVKQGCMGQWKKFTLKSRADKHCNKTVTAKVWSSFVSCCIKLPFCLFAYFTLFCFKVELLQNVFYNNCRNFRAFTG